MPYDYYYRLGRTQQRIYDKSDAVSAIPIAEHQRLQGYTRELQQVLPSGRRASVRSICQNISNELCRQLQIPRVVVVVEQQRPDQGGYEMFGYYEPGQEAEERHALTLWMRTAKRGQVVAFKTFFRTLLHELCHHIDYYHFHWDESFHTEGFYKRESSLFYQLTGA